MVLQLMYSLQQSYLPLQDTKRQSQIDSLVLATIQKTVLYTLPRYDTYSQIEYYFIIACMILEVLSTTKKRCQRRYDTSFNISNLFLLHAGFSQTAGASRQQREGAHNITIQ